MKFAKLATLYSEEFVKNSIDIWWVAYRRQADTPTGMYLTPIPNNRFTDTAEIQQNLIAVLAIIGKHVQWLPFNMQLNRNS